MNLLFTGHDFKFLTPVIEYFEKKAGVSVRIEKQRGHVIEDEREAMRNCRWADVIFCEWALDNLRWYSQNKRPGQVLISRLHSQELESVDKYINATEWENVDNLILICPANHRRMLEKFPQIGAKAVTIYNPIPAAVASEIPKKENSEFHLGFVGIIPLRKRLDLGFEIFEKLRAKDSRWRLFIKGAKPQDYPWMASRVEEMKFYNALFKRIEESPYSQDVVFDKHGSDMLEWYSKIGFLLSTSDFEGSHQAVAEGMASGCIPVIRNWLGADELYPAEYTYDFNADAETAAKKVLSWKKDPAFLKKTEKACRSFAVEHFDNAKIIGEIEALIKQHPAWQEETVNMKNNAKLLLVTFRESDTTESYRSRVEQIIKQHAGKDVKISLVCVHKPLDDKKKELLKSANDFFGVSYDMLEFPAYCSYAEPEDCIAALERINKFIAAYDADCVYDETSTVFSDKKAAFAELAAKLDVSQKSLADLNTKLSAADQQLLSKSAEVASLSAKLADTDQQLVYKSAENCALSEKLVDAGQQLLEKTAETKSLNAKLSDVQKQLSVKTSESSSLNAKLGESQKQLTSQIASNAESQKKLAALEKQLADLQKNYAAEQRKVRSLQSENAILKTSSEELWRIQTTRSYRAVQKINRVRAKVYSALGIEYPRGKQQEKEIRNTGTSIPAASGNRKRLKDLHVGAVMDQFSLSSFKPECDLFTFKPNDWQAKFAEKKPDFVMVESAWNGNDGAWQYKIGTYGGSTRDDLFALLNYCKKESIPTVFWNKEDPPHFDKFKEAAARFDYVFTTDENCIPAYQKECGHNRVYALPFAAQPLLHNPVMTEARSKNICFAGTYYATRFAERREQMDVLFKASEKLGLEIFDRQFGNTGPGYKDYLFPENLRKFIQGRLEYNDMVKAYRRYKIFLNVNSVVNSRTMFSRRVFELLACGTPTVTTPSDGIRHFFGDLVPEITDPVAGYEVMKKIIEDVPYRRRLSAKGVRCVIGKHTYAHRLAEICKTIGLSVAPQWENKIAVVLHNVCDEQATLEMLNLQKEKPALVIGVKADKLVKLLKKAGWNAFNVKKSGEVLDLLKKNPEINAVSFWNGKDAYTAEYLSDAMLALNNYSCDITGMVGVQSYQKGIWTPSGDFSKENFLVDHVFTDTLVFRPGVSRLQDFVESLFSGKEEVSVESGYARTSFEYGLNGAEAKAEAWKEIIL